MILAACELDEQEKAWAFKNPRHLWLQPVLQELYGNATLAVLVARDPRDLCMSHQQKKNDGGTGGGGASGRFSASLDDLEPCLAGWARTWSGILEGDGAMARFAIVRIEDLVVPDPSAPGAASLDVLSCVTRQVHGMKRFTLGAAAHALGTMHSHSSSYGGGYLTHADRSCEARARA